MKTIARAPVIAAITLTSSGFALAEGVESISFWERENLTGDWGGARTNLEESGVTPFAFYDGIFAANVSGGIRTDDDFTGQAYVGVDLDLGKLFGWDGSMFKISLVNRHGDSISRNVGGIYDPMTIFGGQVTYLYQVFLETALNDEWSLKLGRVSADGDFVNHDLYRYSLSTAINGPMRATLLENSITSFPYPVWGSRLKYRPSEAHQFQIGAYLTGPRQWDFTKNGLDFDIRSEDGVSVLLQHDWWGEVCGRPTHTFVGAISSFRDFDNFTGGGITDFLFRTYVHADVEVCDGVTVFGFATYADEDQVAKTPLQISAGVNWEGLIPCRENDRTVAFVTYGQLSDRYGDSIGESVDYEMVYELGHRFQITPAFYLQPSVQYIQNPGGTGKIDDAVVIGTWVGFRF